jgi:hypothetical protein
LLMQGGTMTSGRLWTFAVEGAYCTSCINSFSNTTLPGLVATLRPTSKAASSDIEMRPFARSARKRHAPSMRLVPPVSSAACIASGLVARQLAGFVASITWRSANSICALPRAS